MTAKLAAGESAIDGEVTNVHSSPPRVDRPDSCNLGLTGATSLATMTTERSCMVACQLGPAKARLGQQRASTTVRRRPYLGSPKVL
jgi:hypothetical protein